MTSPPACEGIALLNKPKGKTSFFLVHLLRKLTGVRRIGHAGTLDPFATGVMVLLIGKSYTKQSDSFLRSEKEYRARLLLGISTDSYDIDGEVTFRSTKIPDFSEVEGVLKEFDGEIFQIPPMFSAKKINGKKLYLLAREGITIERQPRKVSIRITSLTYDYPFLEFTVSCSAGTYIRSLADDIGKRLGCGAHLVELTRTRSGSFTLDLCQDIETLDSENLKIIDQAF